MSAQARPTPGPYTLREESHGASIRGVAGVSVGWFGTATIGGANGSHHVDRHEAAANARIFAQALEVLHETGRTPRQLVEEVDRLRVELDKVRAESKIEWEPGRSYTAAELLKRVVNGIRVPRKQMLWPRVSKLLCVGSTVACFVCRWAGRDPDTGDAA